VKKVAALIYLTLATSVCFAQHKLSADTAECGGEVSPAVATSKTAVLSSHTASARMYGAIIFRHNQQDAKAKHCHVVYRLFVATGKGAFTQVHQFEWDTESGEIAGIDLIGFSPDGSKAAANFWLAEGDGQQNRPVVYDLKTKTIISAEMPAVQDRRAPSKTCDDDPYESLDNVTNAGIVTVSVPAIEGCADGGLWSFDPRTGAMKLLRKNSGRKPIQ
jgi:hypothetical protein